MDYLSITKKMFVLAMFLDCPFLIAPSIFSNVYFLVSEN